MTHSFDLLGWHYSVFYRNQLQDDTIYQQDSFKKSNDYLGSYIVDLVALAIYCEWINWLTQKKTYCMWTKYCMWTHIKTYFCNILVTEMVNKQIEGNAATVILLKANFFKNKTKNSKLILSTT